MVLSALGLKESAAELHPCDSWKTIAPIELKLAQWDSWVSTVRSLHKITLYTIFFYRNMRERVLWPGWFVLERPMSKEIPLSKLLTAGGRKTLHNSSVLVFVCSSLHVRFYVWINSEIMETQRKVIRQRQQQKFDLVLNQIMHISYLNNFIQNG